MSGTLYLVATPIGNLEDITLRALRILGEVDLIAAEDTRRSARLLRHYGIATRVTSLHEHNERQKAPRLVDRLQAGSSIALLADAGTPVVSDPGLLFVRLVMSAGIRVVPLPGPSAPITALVATGAPPDSFTFVGFPPRRVNDRNQWCQALANEPRTLIFFESPHRLRTTLRMMLEHWGDRQLALCRELTKIHEECVIRPITELLELSQAPRGEYTGVVWPAPAPAVQAEQLPDEGSLLNELGLTTEAMGTRRGAVKEMARKYGLTSRTMYAAIEHAKSVG